MRGRPLVPGSADGVALVLTQPLSFWGGLDPADGRIIDPWHPQRGASIAGRVLVMASGRGSSSSSSVLAEALRKLTGPVAIVLLEPDEIVLVGALVVQLLDGLTTPVVRLKRDDFDALRTGDHVAVEPDGRLTISSPGAKEKRPLRRGVAALSRPDPAT